MATFLLNAYFGSGTNQQPSAEYIVDSLGKVLNNHSLEGFHNRNSFLVSDGKADLILCRNNPNLGLFRKHHFGIWLK